MHLKYVILPRLSSFGPCAGTENTVPAIDEVPPSSGIISFGSSYRDKLKSKYSIYHIIIRL